MYIVCVSRCTQVVCVLTCTCPFVQVRVSCVYPGRVRVSCVPRCTQVVCTLTCACPFVRRVRVSCVCPGRVRVSCACPGVRRSCTHSHVRVHLYVEYGCRVCVRVEYGCRVCPQVYVDRVSTHMYVSICVRRVPASCVCLYTRTYPGIRASGIPTPVCAGGTVDGTPRPPSTPCERQSSL